jgi:hypothetical protein
LGGIATEIAAAYALFMQVVIVALMIWRVDIKDGCPHPATKLYYIPGIVTIYPFLLPFLVLEGRVLVRALVGVSARTLPSSCGLFDTKLVCKM